MNKRIIVVIKTTKIKTGNIHDNDNNIRINNIENNIPNFPRIRFISRFTYELKARE